MILLLKNRKTCMKKGLIYFHFLFFLFASIQASAADTTVVKSPDGNISFKLFQKNKQLYFLVIFHSKTVIETSALSMTVNEVPITAEIKIILIDRYKLNETYPVLGSH